MKIGVFDSGLGGKSVAAAITEALPDHVVQYVHDSENVPYGSKTPAKLLELVTPILRAMQADGCEIIVLACNTVSTTIIEDLRLALDVPLIEVEPMVQEATQITESGVIAVCATPTTLMSKRYAELKNQFAAHTQVLEPDCSDWSAMIESSHLDHNQIENRISDVCDEGADVIVLGCTHYHWIQAEIEEIASKYANVTVIQPEQLVIGRLKQAIARL